MNRIDEGDGLIGAHRVEQVLVSVDEGVLFGVVESARHGFRLGNPGAARWNALACPPTGAANVLLPLPGCLLLSCLRRCVCRNSAVVVKDILCP